MAQTGQWKAYQTGKFIPLLASKAGFAFKIVIQEKSKITHLAYD